MTGIDVDIADLEALARDLQAAGDKLMDRVRPVVSKAALNVKTDMRDDLRDSQYFKGVARAVSYEVTARATSVEAEVGPVTEGQVAGDLAHIAYFGGAHGGGGTVRDPQRAADEEAPRFVRALEDVVDGLIR